MTAVRDIARAPAPPSVPPQNDWRRAKRRRFTRRDKGRPLPPDSAYVDALGRLEPASRAVLDLSVRRRMAADRIAAMSGWHAAAVGAWIDEALLDVAAAVGVGDPEHLDDVRGRLVMLPASVWTDDVRGDAVAADVQTPRSAAELTAERPYGRIGATLAYAWVLVIGALLVPFRDVWAAEAVVIAILLTVPGLLLLRALRVPGAAVASFPVYVPAASVAVLTAAGLGTNFIAPLLGVADPLRTAPLSAGVLATSLVLLAASATAGPSVSIPWRTLHLRAAHAWPLVLPLLAAAGAARLTASGSTSVAVVAAVAAVVTLFACGLLADRLSKTQLMFVLYGVGLATIWSFTLRGHFVYGFDIASEFNIFERTWNDGVWHAAHSRDAYGAMLSLTVLPSLLHALTGLPLLGVLKIAYPILFAVVPVGIFCLATRFIGKRFAFFAAGFVVVQSYFFQQLPGIARQEIALLMFVALVATMLDRSLPRRAQWPLLGLFGLGVVVSHYSTAYLAAGVLLLTTVLHALVARWRPMPGAFAGVAVATVALVAGCAAWYGPVTHSASNLSDFSSAFREHGLDLLPNSQQGKSVFANYLNGNSQVAVSAQDYEKIAAQEYAKSRRYVHPLPDAGDPRYALRDARVPDPRVTSPLAVSALKKGQLAVAQLANLLAAIGALALVLRRRTHPLARQLGLFGVATLAVLVFVRLSGTAATAYNQERAFVQMMIPLGIAMAWLIEVLSQRGPKLAVRVGAIAMAALALVFVNTIGLRGTFAGGGVQTNLAAKGDDYERFYITQPELAAADWLNVAAPTRDLVYTDRYGQLRVLAATGRVKGLLLNPTPKTLDRHAWVYASATNAIDHRGRGEINTKYSVFEWPAAFLDGHYDTVYSNGSARVYNR